MPAETELDLSAQPDSPPAAPDASQQAAAPDAPPSNTPPVDENEDIEKVMERNFRDLMGEEEKPAAPNAEKPPEKPPGNQAQKPPEKTAEKPPEKAPEKPPQKAAEKSPEKPPTAEPAKQVKRPWEIVRQKEKELAELDARYKKLEQEHTQLKSAPSAGAPDPERERLAKRVEELEGEIRYVNYEKSSEFQEKYHKPYVDLAKNLTAEAMELVIEGADGTARNLTQQEFWKVVAQPSLNEAIKAARELFPDDPTKSNHLLTMRKDIKRAWDAMETAKVEYRGKGAEREKEMQTKQQQTKAQEARMAQLRAEKWKQMNEAAIKNERLREYFQAPDDDAKGKELLTKGFKDADRAFNGGAPLDEGDEPLNEDQLIELHSTVRNKAGAFNYVAYRYRLAQAEIADLKKELEEYQKSDPSNGEKGDKGGAEPEIDETERGLRELEGR